MFVAILLIGFVISIVGFCVVFVCVSVGGERSG